MERQGEVCEPELPDGLEVMSAPPVVLLGEKIVDPRTSDNEELRKWAVGPGKRFYSSYGVISSSRSTSSNSMSVGIPILAGDDVSKDKLPKYMAAVRHMLFEAAVDNRTLAAALAQHGVRILIGGKELRAWRKHPEVKRHFLTGLGGGAPWFPSTGVLSDETPETLLEELFHTIQYTVMRPSDVCMYHKAYAKGVADGLYTTDGSGKEVDGEPVPTIQADEYLAMALHRWLGSSVGHRDEYKVSGSSSKPGGKTGREYLRESDPQAFCFLSTVFRSDDAWNPNPKKKPWKTNPNRGMDMEEVADFCKPVLSELAAGCPSSSVTWPQMKVKSAAKSSPLVRRPVA
jgi:hypothetical protein